MRAETINGWSCGMTYMIGSAGETTDCSAKTRLP